MEFVKVALPLWHALVAFPGFRNHHHHGMCEAAPRKNEELKAVIKFLRVGAVFADDRQELLQVFAEYFTGELHLTGVKPVLIAAHSVDLTIVAKVTERLSARPTWEGIGRETGVSQSER